MIYSIMPDLQQTKHEQQYLQKLIIPFLINLFHIWQTLKNQPMYVNNPLVFLLPQQLFIRMGCGGSGIDTVKLNTKRQTVYGVLEVSVLQAVIEHETSSVFSMDPYVNIKFSNQKHRGTVVKKGGKNPKFSDFFKFTVNSCYKYFGRCLEVELMDSNKSTSDSLIGFGIIDLDPYLNALQIKSPELAPGQIIQKNPQTISLRCFLNYDRKPAGFITLSATFKEEKVDIINFRFQTVEFKRSCRTFGDMNCSVRVTIGEQILETKKNLDTKLYQPSWKNEHLSFACPTSTDNILIEVMDQDNVVGRLNMSKLDFLVQKVQQQSFDREILYENEVIGKLKFNTLLNHNPIFKQLQGEYKKKTEQEKMAAPKEFLIKKSQIKSPEQIKKEQDQKKPVQIKLEQGRSILIQAAQKKPEEQPEQVEAIK